MSSCGSGIQSSQDLATKSGHAGIKESFHLSFREGLEFDDDFGEPVCQAPAQTRQERTLPDVLIEGQNHIETLHGMPERPEKRSQSKCCRLIGRKPFEIIRDQHHPHQQGHKSQQSF